MNEFSVELICSCVFHREHLIRLQHENKMLKLAQEGSDNEKIALLQSLLEDANRRKNELETENRSGNTELQLNRAFLSYLMLSITNFEMLEAFISVT